MLNVDASLQRLLQRVMSLQPDENVTWQQLQGLSGSSWSLSYGTHRLLVRGETAPLRLLGVDRYREARLLRQMAAQSLSPRVLARHRQWLLLEWLDGEAATSEQFNTLAQTGALAQLLTHIHRQPPSGSPLQLTRQLTRYGTAVDRRRLSPHWHRLHQQFIRQSLPRPLKVAPLHMDIHAGNLIVSTDNLSGIALTWRLIDWEYAADGDIALEIAALFCANGWEADLRHLFLQQYAQWGYHDVRQLAQQVARWEPWVKYLMLMWYEVRWQQSHNEQFLQLAAPLRQIFALD